MAAFEGAVLRLGERVPTASSPAFLSYLCGSRGELDGGAPFRHTPAPAEGLASRSKDGPWPSLKEQA